MQLPPPDTLERTCKGLALLDAILSEEWELRYFSFNAAWDGSGQERMASMRNGEGDGWFFVFSGERVFFKAHWHEHAHEDPALIFDGLPPELEAQRVEPAFSTVGVTFGGWYEPATGWTLRGNPEPMKDELSILTGDPEVYRGYAKAYFEVDVPEEAIAYVLAGKTLDASLVASIAPDRTLESLEEDLEEIGA